MVVLRKLQSGVRLLLLRVKQQQCTAGGTDGMYGEADSVVSRRSAIPAVKPRTNLKTVNNIQRLQFLSSLRPMLCVVHLASSLHILPIF